MKKNIFILLCSAFILFGCASKKTEQIKQPVSKSLTNEQLENKVKKAGYEIVFSKTNNGDNVNFVSFKAKDHEIFYNSNNVLGIFNDDDYLVSETANKGFKNTSGSCEYNLKNNRDYRCDKKDIKNIKSLHKKFESILSGFETEKDKFIKFMKFEYKKEKEKFYALDDGERLLELNFKLENGLYVTDDFPYHLKTDVNQVAIDLVNHNMIFLYDISTISFNWDTNIITETRPNYDSCTYDYNVMGITGCSSYDDAPTLLIGMDAMYYGKALKDFQIDTGIRLQENR